MSAENSGLRRTFNQRQALALHSAEGGLTAAVDCDCAPIPCDFADYRVVPEVAHTIPDKYLVKADVPRKRSTHGCLMLPACFAGRAAAR